MKKIVSLSMLAAMFALAIPVGMASAEEREGREGMRHREHGRERCTMIRKCHRDDGRRVCERVRICERHR